MKVNKSSADSMFPFNTPTGSMNAAQEASASVSSAQNSFNDYDCVPESKAADDKAAQGDLHYF